MGIFIFCAVEDKKFRHKTPEQLLSFLTLNKFAQFMLVLFKWLIDEKCVEITPTASTTGHFGILTLQDLQKVIC